mgnify:CR=1 FL=1
MYAKNIAENMAGTFGQYHFTVDKPRLKDALDIAAFVEDRQAIRHENKDVAVCLSFRGRKERSKNATGCSEKPAGHLSGGTTKGSQFKSP